MSKMIQIRNVPDDLHRTLKVRAAKAGMTLSGYLLSEIEQVTEKPTLAEMMGAEPRSTGRGGRDSGRDHPPDAGRRQSARPWLAIVDRH